MSTVQILIPSFPVQILTFHLGDIPDSSETPLKDANRYGLIQSNKVTQCEAAKGGFRNYSKDKLKQIFNIVHNMVPNISNIPLEHMNHAHKY